MLLVDDVVVARDISELLGARRPGIRVEHLRDRASAAHQVANARPSVLLSTVPVGEMRRLGIDAAAAGAGTRVVVLNGSESAAEKAATGWAFVARPFAEDVLLEAVLPAGP